MQTVAAKLLESIEKNRAHLKDRTATVGFDGFIDYICRVVKSEENDVVEFYPTMKEFGLHLAERSGKSCGVELIDQTIKAGGNMPIMSIALTALGVGVNCIGALGYPELHPEFAKSMKNSGCKLYSIGEPGITNALEFDDGKAMLVRMQPLNHIDWNEILKIIPLEELYELYCKSDLIGFVNWSELKNANDIWRGMLRDLFGQYKMDKEQRMFFDLADCSRKKLSELKAALELMNEFSGYCRVVLGLNENECYQVLDALGQYHGCRNVEEAGAFVYHNMKLDTLVIHTTEAAYAWNSDGFSKANTYFCKKPKISTGGGDNFNAGICTAMLMQLEMEQALLFANVVSRLYISNGMSPTLTDITAFIKEEGLLE